MQGLVGCACLQRRLTSDCHGLATRAAVTMLASRLPENDLRAAPAQRRGAARCLGDKHPCTGRRDL